MIKVILFGMLAQKAGRREIMINTEGKENEVKLSDIVTEVKEKYLKGASGPLIYAVNEEQSDPETVVMDGDEVAIMPPFSGG
jgi:molybdopterin converting factor small subunit